MPPKLRASSPSPKKLHETLLDPTTTTELGFISDNSSYSFVLYGKRARDACITINRISFTQFCMKITIVGPQKIDYEYTTVNRETISKFISTEEAIRKEVRLQTLLDNKFRKNNKRPIVPYVIHDCFLSSEEFSQLFVEDRAETLRDNVRHIIQAIQDNLKDPSRRVHIFFMEYMDNTKYKTLAQRISEWRSSNPPRLKAAYHRMAAILACVAGLNIFPYDASEPNVMLDDLADDVRLIDLGNTFDFYNQEDSDEIVRLYNDIVKSHLDDRIPRDKLTAFFIGENDRRITTAEAAVDLREMFKLNTLTVNVIHKNLITLAFIDFVKNLMIMKAKPVGSEVMATSYCKSRFAMESVYREGSFANFETFLNRFTLSQENLEETYPLLNTVKAFIIEIMNNSPIRQPNPLGKCSILGGGSQPTFIKRYLPDTLSIRDKSRQRNELTKSRRLYKQGKYYTRKAMRSFKSKPSKHLDRARSLYHVDKIRPTRELSRKTGCSLKGLRQIVKKGEGAYYSSGSRPNQTSQSWGNARLASAITGGNASLVDFHILDKECHHRKPAFRLAQKPRK